MWSINKRRYFLISYCCDNNKSKSIGNLWIDMVKFPSNNHIKKSVMRLNLKLDLFFERGEIVVTNIFEFKSAEDFTSYRDGV